MFLRARVLPFRSPRASGDWVELDSIRKVPRKYEQRFSLLLSSSLSPERIDESVLRESPLDHEHTGSGGVRHSSCVTGAAIVVVCCKTNRRQLPEPLWDRGQPAQSKVVTGMDSRANEIE